MRYFCSAVVGMRLLLCTYTDCMGNAQMAIKSAGRSERFTPLSKRTFCDTEESNSMNYGRDMCVCPKREEDILYKFCTQSFHLRFSALEKKFFMDLEKVRRHRSCAPNGIGASQGISISLLPPRDLYYFSVLFLFFFCSVSDLWLWK